MDELRQSRFCRSRLAFTRLTAVSELFKGPFGEFHGEIINLYSNRVFVNDQYLTMQVPKGALTFNVSCGYNVLITSFKTRSNNFYLLIPFTYMQNRTFELAP